MPVRAGVVKEEMFIRACRELGFSAKQSPRENHRRKNDVIISHLSRLPFDVAIQLTLRLDHWRKMEAFIQSRTESPYPLSVYLETSEETPSQICVAETIEAVLDFRMRRREKRSFGLRVVDGEGMERFNIETRAADLKAEMDPKATADRRLWGIVSYAECTFILIRGNDNTVYIAYPGNTEDRLDRCIRRRPEAVLGTHVTFLPTTRQTIAEHTPIARAVLWKKDVLEGLDIEDILVETGNEDDED